MFTHTLSFFSKGRIELYKLAYIRTCVFKNNNIVHFLQVTVKNLQCIATLLDIINHHGDFMDTAWPLLLTALQVKS